MSLTIESLKSQLAQFETQFEEAKSTVYRIDGAIQVVKNQIASLENPEKPSQDDSTSSDAKPALKAVNSKKA